MKHPIIEIAEQTTASLEAVTRGLEALAREIPKLNKSGLSLAESNAIAAQFERLVEASARARACTLIISAMGGLGRDLPNR